MTLRSAARRLALTGVLALTMSVLPFAAAFAQTPGDDDNDCQGGVAIPGDGVPTDSPDDTPDDSPDDSPDDFTPIFDREDSPDDSPDDTADDTYVVDLDAGDNAGASVLSSRFTFECADEALIARSDIFPDSLSSGPLQGGGRPLLLTASDSLDARVDAELDRLGVERVFVLGNEEAISEEVMAELEAGYEVIRLGGPTRIETAVEIAEYTLENETADDAERVAILARSHDDPSANDPTQAWADSAAAGGWAAENEWPVLLTYPPVDDDPQTPDVDESEVGSQLVGSTREHIEAADYDRIIIVGGTEAVGTEVEAEVEGLVENVERVSGATRFDTAVAVAEARGFEDSDDAEFTILAEGQAEDGWVDGFTAAALSGLTPAPIVLSNSASEDLPAATTEFLVPETGDNADGDPDSDAGNGDFDGDTSLQDQPDALAGVCYPKVPDAPADVDADVEEGSAEELLGQCGEFADELDADQVFEFELEDDADAAAL